MTWDDVVYTGRPLPGISSGCASSWRHSGKDRRLAWDSGRYLCLSALAGRSYRPQGVGGSATAAGYLINGQPAVDRDIIVTSWYSRSPVRGLIAPNRGGESTTRLVVLDMEHDRYNTVELVRPVGDRFRALGSHGSGVVWTGQYLYSSSHGYLWMYNADDLLQIKGRFVLPAIARWRVSGTGGLSSISLDDTSTPTRLVGINYTTAGQTYVQTFELDSAGLLSDGGAASKAPTVLKHEFGEPRRTARSADSTRLSGTHYQGVASTSSYGFANSSGRVVVFSNTRILNRYRLPSGTAESIYLDSQRGRFVSVTEHGSQFLFELPLSELTAAAGR